MRAPKSIKIGSIVTGADRGDPTFAYWTPAQFGKVWIPGCK